METIIWRALRLLFSGGAVIAGSGQAALAQQTGGETPMARVEVTGSSLKRVDAETALPVQLISRADIARTGATSTENLLAMIAPLSSAGATTGAGGAGNSTGGMSSVSLRGLGSTRTLVLVNGRRLGASAGRDATSVNVNAIPLAAIERIEILKDGASGVYGSDAIAGVVNFILSRRVEGVEVSASIGSPTAHGGGQDRKASIVGGIRRGALSAVLSGSHEKETALFGRSRDYASTATRLPYYDGGGATGSGNIQGSWVNGRPGADFVPNGSGYGNPLASPDNCAAIRMAMLPNGFMKTPYCYYDSGPDVGLTPARELVNVTGNASYRLDADTELFGDVLLSHSRVVQTFQPAPARTAFFASDRLFQAQGVDPALLLFPSNPAYQSIAVPFLQSHGFTSLIGKPLAITNRVFDYGPRQTVDTARQDHVVLGARGKVAAQDYEVAMTHNASRLNNAVTTGYFSQVAYARIINDPANNWNPWRAGGVQGGALADELRSAAFSGDALKVTSTSDTLDARIAGAAGRPGDLAPQYALGLQSRRERYTLDPSAAYRSGDIAGLGGALLPIDRSRVVHSLYGELNVPLLKTLEGNLAVRDDRYNDVGNTVNYKINARWQPVRQWLLRASYGTGFRAPALADLWTPQRLSTSVPFSDPATQQSGLQVSTLFGGNPDLQPEKSKQYSVGTVWQPAGNASIGLDWFRITVRDIIATPSAQEVVSRFRAGDPAFAGLVTLQGNQITQIRSVLANLGNATVQGVDVSGNYRLDLGSPGRVDLALNGTWMSRFDQASPGGVVSHKVGTMVDAAGNPVIGADSGGVILRWKGQVAATWTAGAWATTLIDNFRSGYEVGHDLNGKRVFIGRESIFDANLAYRGIRNLTLAVGVKNLFDRQPDTIGQAVTNQFQSGYDIYQYDPRGRFAYVTATYRF